jgi:hypothetical protein
VVKQRLTILEMEEDDNRFWVTPTFFFKRRRNPAMPVYHLSNWATFGFRIPVIEQTRDLPDDGRSRPVQQGNQGTQEGEQVEGKSNE